MRKGGIGDIEPHTNSQIEIGGLLPRAQTCSAAPPTLCVMAGTSDTLLTVSDLTRSTMPDHDDDDQQVSIGRKKPSRRSHKSCKLNR